MRAQIVLEAGPIQPLVGLPGQIAALLQELQVELIAHFSHLAGLRLAQEVAGAPDLEVERRIMLAVPEVTGILAL